MKIAVIVFPGSNCDRDVADALKKSMNKEPHMVWHGESTLPEDLDLIVLPGGFSYGDYLRSGAIAARSPIMGAVIEASEQGRYILGICNGFQILTECGLLPGTLRHNKNLKFICKNTYLKVNNAKTAITGAFGKDQVIKFPIAHQEGNYYVGSDGLKAMQDKDLIVLSYCDEKGNVNDAANPNGSINNIAAIMDKKKKIFGMMPHPERAVDKLTGNSDGKYFFDILVRCVI
jgi:phosphoribosylformylglycinamidine synthase